MNWWRVNGFDLSEDFELCEIWVKPYFVFMVAGNDVGEGFGHEIDFFGFPFYPSGGEDDFKVSGVIK